MRSRLCALSACECPMVVSRVLTVWIVVVILFNDDHHPDA
jgi:hypothetical protein